MCDQPTEEVEQACLGGKVFRVAGKLEEFELVRRVCVERLKHRNIYIYIDIYTYKYKYILIINRMGVHLLCYGIWIRGVFWLGPLGLLGPKALGSYTPKTSALS